MRIKVTLFNVDGALLDTAEVTINAGDDYIAILGWSVIDGDSIVVEELPDES